MRYGQLRAQTLLEQENSKQYICRECNITFPWIEALQHLDRKPDHVIISLDEDSEDDGR